MSRQKGEFCLIHPDGSINYHLKDHLGNVRMTFGTRAHVDTFTATLEDANATKEQAEFYPSYDSAVTVNTTLYNHTPGAQSPNA